MRSRRKMARMALSKKVRRKSLSRREVISLKLIIGTIPIIFIL